MEVAPSTIRFIVAATFLNHRVLDQAFPRLVESHFRENYERGLMIIWWIVRNYARLNGGNMIPHEALGNAISTLNHNGRLKQSDKEQLNEFMAFLDINGRIAWEDPNITRWLLGELESFLTEREVLPMMRQLIENPTQEGLHNILKTDSRMRMAIGQPVEFTVGDGPLFHHSPRTPTGVDFFDRITGSNGKRGGLYKGEAVLVLAPTGGGKTLMNVQMACSLARNGHDAVFMSYEQSVDPLILNRAQAFLLDCPIGYFEDANNQALFHQEPELVAKWKEEAGRALPNLHIYDMLHELRKGGAAGGVMDIRQYIQDLQDKGHSPMYVGIDWYGPFFDNYASRHGLLRTKSKVDAMTEVSRELSELSDELQINIFIYHQLENATARKKELRVPEAQAAKDCHSLADYMSTVLCFSQRESAYNIAVCGVPKLRNGQPNQQHFVQMQAELSRWVVREDVDFAKDNKSIYIRGEGKEATFNEDDCDEDPAMQMSLIDVNADIVRSVMD